MKRLIFTLTPKTAFATPLHGDTLFGQCCWAIRHLYSETRLTELLQDYTNGEPFLVLSDALPQGYLVRPTVPSKLLDFNTNDPKNRKEQKGKKWLPVSVLTQPLKEWGKQALNEKEMMAKILNKDVKELEKKDQQHYLTYSQDHNSLNRLTGTTGGEEGSFAPFQQKTYWYHPSIKLNLIAELDESLFSETELTEILQWIGETGYGKEASCGLGKFDIECDNSVYEKHPEANAYLTLAACAPQGLHWKTERCYYQTFTRFGRHGDLAVHQEHGAFKNPVLLAAPFAVLTPVEFNPHQGFTGQGLTGVSQTIKQTVQQGYAPVLPIRLEIE